MRKRNLLLVLEPHVFRRRPNLRFLLVLPHAVEMDECHDAQANAPAHDDCDFGWDVAGGVTGAESLGACRSMSMSMSISCEEA